LQRQIRIHRLPDHFRQKTPLLGRQVGSLSKEFLGDHGAGG
jgi:hypothetical protein